MGNSMKALLIVAALALSAPLGSRAAHAMASAPRATCQANTYSKTCTAAMLADPVTYRQILVIPAGYGTNDNALFMSDFNNLFKSFFGTLTPASNPHPLYNQIGNFIFIADWLPGGALGTPTVNFGAAIETQPIRQNELNMAINNTAVEAEVANFKANYYSQSVPWEVVVLYKSTAYWGGPAGNSVGANTAPSSFLHQPYGIVKLTSGEAAQAAPNYVVVHEMSHGGLNFLDEYTESTFNGMSITELDAVTFLTQGFTGAIDLLLGIYDMKISEILAANGNDNVDVTEYPSRVGTPGALVYAAQGGFFFPLGAWHYNEPNIMWGTTNFNHSASQYQVVQEALVAPRTPPRPNDRIRIAGPFPLLNTLNGSDTNLLMYDGDKNHRYHPTQSYDVQIGFYNRVWCGIFCGYNDVWTVIEKNVAPQANTIQLNNTELWYLANLAQDLACQISGGSLNIGQNGETTNLCSINLASASASFLPSMTFWTPYQSVDMPLPQWMSQYWWRFRTNNGTQLSNFTGWNSFNRAF
jgi:hypothetical protein